MWQALANVEPLSKRDGGKLFLALYNEQGRASRVRLRIKQLYNRLPAGYRWLVLAPVYVRLWGPTTLRDLIQGKPFSSWRNCGKTEGARGMDPWIDVLDWIGGLPFEVSKPEEIFDYYRERGFSVLRLKTCAGGHGCNEFVFVREPRHD